MRGLLSRLPSNFPSLEQARKLYFLVRLLGPKRRVTELCSPAFQFSEAQEDLGIQRWTRPSSCPGQIYVLTLKKQ